VKTHGTITGNEEIDDNPGFVDASRDNYTLRKDAEVFTLMPDFIPIPQEKIGLYKDAFRKDLPADPR
jgi:hypothetical protein